MFFSIEIGVFLFFIAVIAAIIDTIAGGGGLLILPALVIVGLPPDVALATNKVQGSVGTLTATLFFISRRVINIKQMSMAIVCIFIGAVLGSVLVLHIDRDILFALLPVLLIAAGFYYLFSKKIQDVETKAVIPFFVFSFLIAPLLGFYDGFFGPGAGSLYTLVLILLCGFGATRATAHAKLLNFASNISSCIYFIFFANIAWFIGIVMICGQIIGAYIGSHIVLRKGALLIRKVAVTVCFVMSLRILWQQLM